MAKGYVKLHRKAIDSRVFSDAELWRHWTWLLMRANHKRRFFEGQTVERGSLIAGTRSTAEILGCSPSTIHRHWKRFVEWGMVVLKAERNYTIITICNYSTYNPPIPKGETPTERKRSARETPVKHPRSAGDTPAEPTKNYQELQALEETVPSEPSSEPPQATSEPKPAKPQDLPSMLEFPTVGNAPVWHLTMPAVQTLKDAFPTLDILGECRKARAWCESNPAKRKTPGGMRKFLFGWMERAQNRGSPSAGNFGKAPTEPVSMQAALEMAQKNEPSRMRAIRSAD